MKTNTNRIAQFLLLAAIIGYAWVIEWLFGWQKLLAAWHGIPWWYPLLAIVLMFFTYVIRGWRIYDYFLPLTKTTNGNGLLLCCKIMLSHNLLNNLLPMRSGEASFPLLMREFFGANLAYTSAGLVLLRILDLQALLCIGCLAFMAYSHVPLWLWGAFGLLMLSPLLLLPATPLLKSILLRVKQPKIHHLLEQLIEAMPAHFGALFRSWLLTWICWGVKIVVFTLVLRWFADTDWWRAMGVCIGGELSSVLPIHAPAGLGTYEASMMAAGKLMGIQGNWILFGGVQLHLLMIVSTLIGGVVALMIRTEKRDSL